MYLDEEFMEHGFIGLWRYRKIGEPAGFSVTFLVDRYYYDTDVFHTAETAMTHGYRQWYETRSRNPLPTNEESKALHRNQHEIGVFKHTGKV